MVMFAAMGLPDESERYDAPSTTGGGQGAGGADASYLYDAGEPRELSFSSVDESRTRAATSFDRMIGYDRRKSSAAVARIGAAGGKKKDRIMNLGYDRKAGGGCKKAPSLGIFKQSRCSMSNKGKNEFDEKQGAWVRKRGHDVKTDATRLFQERFTDSRQAAFGREVYKAFDAA